MGREQQPKRTISQRQQELAARRVAERGLAGRVSVELRDYRDVEGEFDAICSVEMISIWLG